MYFESLSLPPQNKKLYQEGSLEMVRCSGRESWDTKKDSVDFYNATAASYRELYTDEQIRKYDVALKSLRAIPVGTVLDVGCGQGLFLQRISENSFLRVGVDVSLKMLEEAKEVTRSVADLLCADADYLPFKEQVFDSVFSFTLLQNMPDPSFTLCEMLRITGRSGIVLVSFPKRSRALEEICVWFKKNIEPWVKVDSDTVSKDHMFIFRRTPVVAIRD